MLVEQQAPAADHLGLDPDSEHQTQLVDPVREPGDSVGQLPGVHIPVAEAGGVVIALSEPAVIQYEEFHTQVLGGLGELDDLAFGEVEVGGFPVVAEHRALAEFPGSAHNVAVDEIVHVRAGDVGSEG